VSGSQVTFQFFGSTAGAGPGSFTINLSGFTGILGVSLASGGLGGATITDSSTSSSLSFTFTTPGDFNAVGGNTVVFNVVTPEPSSVVLLSTFLAGAVFLGRRRLLVRGSKA
jgi:hypothetical protein